MHTSFRLKTPQKSVIPTSSFAMKEISLESLRLLFRFPTGSLRWADRRAQCLSPYTVTALATMLDEILPV